MTSTATPPARPLLRAIAALAILILPLGPAIAQVSDPSLRPLSGSELVELTASSPAPTGPTAPIPATPTLPADPAREVRATGSALSEEILYRAAGKAGRPLQESRWSAVGKLSDEIARAQDCGLGGKAPGTRLNAAFIRQARMLAACRGGSMLLEGVSEDTFTMAMWQAAMPNHSMPDAFQRALAISHTLEGTDYDDIIFNACGEGAGDTASVFTWGPYGATLGWSGHVADILNRVDRSVLEAAFNSAGARGLDQLLGLKGTKGSRTRFPGAAAMIAGVCAAPGQKAAWRKAFEQLGAEKSVREAYEAHAWQTSGWFRFAVDEFAQMWREVGLEPTEVDFAFFLDRAIHMGWSRQRFQSARHAIARALASDGDQFTNAEARFALADAVRPSARPDDRIARDGIFLIDAADQLRDRMAASATWPADWQARWVRRSGIRAADAGLSDSRPAVDWLSAIPVG